ncbi:hypothetical protein BDW74DRAFT_189547 [Aspergillus multicolor]|uniref:uncharacterized protein n=1 Tax=Aspergillus multicolor TaxID=41759 RepID=UPI003CCDE188
MENKKLILVIGGTGAQGSPVVKALSATNRYAVRVLTRDPTSPRAKALAALPHVTLHQGSQDNQRDLHSAFRGVYGAWVNLDGFTLGEKSELFYGIRAYEIARHHGVRHYVWANSDYALRKAGWDERYHWGHNDAKGRIGDLILGHGQQAGGMVTSLLTTGPYMDMLFDGMFVPEERKGEEGVEFVWENPAADGKIPLIALDDIGAYTLWIFDNPSISAGLDLEVATEQVSFTEIAATFTKVTGIKGFHRRIPLDEYLPKAEPYPGAYANWTVRPDEQGRDESFMTWRENFTAWWRYWSEGRGATRDMAMLDRIHPDRIPSLEAWMRLKGYDGRRRAVLKDIEGLRGEDRVERG